MPTGIWISPPRVNAETAPIKNLAYTSDADSFKIAKLGLTAKSGASDLYITHGLGYKPFCWVYFKDGTGLMAKYNQGGRIADTDFRELRIVDSGTNDFYYYIFVNLIL